MDKQLQNIRIARVSTVPFFVLTQLRTQLDAIIKAGANVSVVASDDPLSVQVMQIEGCDYKPVYIARDIRLFADLLTLIKLWRLFRKQQFDIVHSTTPKAGLLCAIAAKLAGVPIRLHTYTGQAWVTMHGIKKNIVKGCDKLIAVLNTQCYADGLSQKNFLITNKVIVSKKITVLGSGSLAGVDTKRFSQDNFSVADKDRTRTTLAIQSGSQVLLFVGRITKEKGIFELIAAVHALLHKNLDIILLVIGPFEKGIEAEIRAHAQQLCGNKVIFAGFHSDPERLISIADILCLPSYREGFGTVVIEAAAMGVPVVGTRIYGLTDAVVDGETGLLVEPKNSEQLAAALERLISNSQLKLSMGERAKERATSEFDSKKCGDLLVGEYARLLAVSRQAKV